MKTCIGILCDNYISAPGLVGEHGFALMIELSKHFADRFVPASAGAVFEF